MASPASSQMALSFCSLELGMPWLMSTSVRTRFVGYTDPRAKKEGRQGVALLSYCAVVRA